MAVGYTNVNRKGGALPLKHLNGSPYVGKGNIYKKESSNAIAPGDFMTLAGGTETSSSTGILLADIATGSSNSAKILGACSAIQPIIGSNITNLDKTYYATSDTGYLFVIDDPDTIFEVQEDSSGGAIAANGPGLQCAQANISANSSGVSNCMIKSSTLSTSSSQLRVLQLVQRVDNSIGNYARWETMINTHNYRAVAI